MSRKLSVIRMSLISIVVATLSACGGGGGGGGGEVQEDQPGQTEGGGGDTSSDGDNTTGGDTTGGTDGEGSESGGDTTGGGDGSGSAGDGSTDGDGEGDTGGDTGGGEDGDDVPDNEAVVDTSGRTVTALFANSGPVTGAPGAAMRALDGYTTNWDGYLALYGSYASGNLEPDALWAGKPSDVKMLLSTGSSIEGLPDNEKYGHTNFMSLASDGSVGHVVTLTGPVQNDALVETDTVASTVLVETGDELAGFGDRQFEIEEFTRVSHSTAGTAFVAETTSGYYDFGLWISDDDGDTIVAETYDNTIDSAPELSNSCRVFVNSSYSTEESYMRLLDSGELVFMALLRNYTSGGPCVQGSALLSYSDGVYQSLMAEGDIVPNASASTITDISLLKVLEDGTSVVSATLETPTGNAYQPDTKISYWSVSLDGSKNLLALEGEEVQVGDSVETISSATTYYSTGIHTDYSDGGHFGMRVDFGDEVKATLLGGAGHQGQPHGVITAPGASALNYLIDRTATLPEPFKDTEYFSTIGIPTVENDGSLVFYGEVSSSVLNAVIAKAIWSVDTEGNLAELVEEGDQVRVGGVSQGLYELVQERGYYYSQANTGRLQATRDGGLFFRADLNNSYGSDVLVYMSPEGQ